MVSLPKDPQPTEQTYLQKKFRMIPIDNYNIKGNLMTEHYLFH